MELEKAEAIFL